MIREALVEKGRGGERDFRWRGGEVSRIEGFSDAVFAFAVTLLVVSLEVPRTFDELLATMRGFAPFAVSFSLLMLVWFWHYRFFRRYGLNDNVTITLNAVLLFVVLFYIYPLKFVFTLLINNVLFDLGFQSFNPDLALPDGRFVSPISEAQAPTLMLIFSLGYLAVHLVFALLYLHAYRKRATLDLTVIEIIETRSSIKLYMLSVGLGLLSLALVIFGGVGYTAWAGNIYWLIPVISTYNGMTTGRRIRLAQAAEAHSSP